MQQLLIVVVRRKLNGEIVYTFIQYNIYNNIPSGSPYNLCAFKSLGTEFAEQVIWHPYEKFITQAMSRSEFSS